MKSAVAASGVSGERYHALAPHLERALAGDHQRQARAPAQEGGEVRRGGDELLVPVQDEHDPPVPQVRRHALHRWEARNATVQRRGHEFADELGFAHRGQVQRPYHQVGAVGQEVAQLGHDP
ncbi:hypothetical protein ACFQ1L_18375 [Phytohabitans flavus]|uniref:hypothetical protein n=1 Tax=Phytohabitans flavus TaxID=1076124 RepID=UPI003632FE12